MNVKLILTLSALGLLACLVPMSVIGDAELGIGIFPVGVGGYHKKETIKEPADSFLDAVSKEFGQKESEVAALYRRGYGRNELIKVLLITRKSGKDLLEIVRLRDKNKTLSEIADKYGIHYHEILGEAELLRNKINAELSLRNE